MLTYITRRILYSIPVLIVSTFLSFTFVSLAGNPTARCARIRGSRTTRCTTSSTQYHLDRSIPVRYWYWVQDVFTHKLGNSLVDLQPIWPDITRTIGHTAQVIIIAEILALILGVAVGIFSAIRQYSPFDYSFTSLSFLGYRDADVLARAAAPDPLRRHLPEMERADLLHLGSEQPGAAGRGRSTGCSTSRCR